MLFNRVIKREAILHMVCAFYTHTCFNQREREREKGAPGVHWRLNDLLEGEICTTGQIGF